MLLDALQKLSSAQPVTSSAVSTNSIDRGPQWPGDCTPLCAAITVDQSATASGSATVAFQIISSASADLSSPNVVASSDAIPKAELIAHRRIIFVKAESKNVPAGHCYLGLQYIVANGPLTAGKFTAYLVESAIGAPVYGSGFTVA